jgi:hypothetical protein
MLAPFDDAAPTGAGAQITTNRTAQARQSQQFSQAPYFQPSAPTSSAPQPAQQQAPQQTGSWSAINYQPQIAYQPPATSGGNIFSPEYRTAQQQQYQTYLGGMNPQEREYHDQYKDVPTPIAGRNPNVPEYDQWLSSKGYAPQAPSAPPAGLYGSIAPGGGGAQGMLGLASQLSYNAANAAPVNVAGQKEMAKESANDLRYQAEQANRESAASRGVSGGAVQARENDIRDAFNQDLTRNYRGIEAAGQQQGFANLMAALQGANQTAGAFGQQQGLDLQGELGRGSLALQGELGRGNLALGQGNLALQGELGRGGLSLDQQRLAETIRQYDKSFGLNEANSNAANSRANEALSFEQQLKLWGLNRENVERLS